MENNNYLTDPEYNRKLKEKSEAVTVSYAEYQRRLTGRAGGTVHLTDGGMCRDIDPVEIVRSESQNAHVGLQDLPVPEEPFFPVHDNNSFVRDESGSEVTVKPQRNNRERAAAVIRFSEPVGWLVCIEGPDFGQSFPLKEGKNFIGRSDEMDVVLKNDPAVSRNKHALVEYIEQKRSFYASSGEAHKLVYMNDDFLLVPVRMEKNDILSLGDSSLMLIPCCDESFSWKDMRKK